MSGYTEAKPQNYPEKVAQQRETVNKMQQAAVRQYRHRRLPKNRDSVTFSEANKSHSQIQDDATPKHQLNKTQLLSDQQKPNFSSKILEQYKSCVKESDSETETVTEIDSLYDNDRSFKNRSESSAESEIDVSEEIHESIQNLQEGLNRITNNYVRRVKSQVVIAMGKLKLQDKLKPPQKKKVVEHETPEKKKFAQTEDLYMKMEMMKRESYRKIEANLTQLKHIDSVTSAINKNYASITPKY